MAVKARNKINYSRTSHYLHQEAYMHGCFFTHLGRAIPPAVSYTPARHVSFTYSPHDGLRALVAFAKEQTTHFCPVNIDAQISRKQLEKLLCSSGRAFLDNFYLRIGRAPQEEQPSVTLCHRGLLGGGANLSSCGRKKISCFPAPDPHFIGRESILERLSTMIHLPSDPSPLQVLCGPRGVGKSQTAFTFARRHEKDFSLIWTLRCAEKRLFEDDLLALAETLDLPLKHKNPDSCMAAAYQYLEQSRNEHPWLLIFTDVEQMPRLPRKGGLILLTTSNDSLHAAEGGLDIPSLSPQEIQSQTLPFPDCEQLTAALPPSSLLIGLAIRSITTNRWPVREYLQKCGHSSTEIVHLSARELKEKSPPAAEFLLAASHLDADYIPLEFFEKWIEKKNIRPSDRDQIFDVLIDSSLVRYNAGLCTFSMHRVIQSAVRVQDGSRRTFIEAVQLINELAKEFDSQEPETWDCAKEVLFQIDSLRASPHFTETPSQPLVSLLLITGIYLQIREKDYEAAITHYQEALRVLGAGDDQNLTAGETHHKIGICCKILERYETALESFLQALPILVRFHGPTHADVARLFNDTGIVLENLGFHQSALDFYMKAVETCVRLYGEKDSDVAFVCHNIGKIFTKLEDDKRALEFHQRAFNIRLELYGQVHLDVRESCLHVVDTLERLGRRQNAATARATLETIDKELRFFGIH